MEEFNQDDVKKGFSLQGTPFFSKKYLIFRKLHHILFYGQVIMRQNNLLTIMFIITGSATLVFSGCQKPNQINQQSQTSVTDAPKITRDPNTSPAIQFDKTSLDFGKVGPGTVTTMELKFHNTGKGILKISEISQCCGIVAKLDKDEYQPGDTGVLTVEFHASGAIGVLERKPIVYSNDPVKPEVELYVKADIVQKVFWEPESIKLFLNKENVESPKLKVWCDDGQAFAITGVRSTGDCITADFDPTLKKTEHILDLKVNKDKLPEQLYGQIDVSMNHPQGDIATIFFEVVPKYTLSPKPLYVFHLQENKVVNETIKVINNYKKDFEIESVSSKDNTIKMVDAKKTGDDYEINIEITPPTTPKGERRFTDVIYINLNDGEQLALNFIGYYD